jgi:large subunit ribosomal protein L15
MLKLHTIKKHPQSTSRKKVVGRGLGSGHGTYSTRGGKGQTARTGHSKMPAGFEGGRQPLVRQLPKLRGFKSLSQKSLAIGLDKLKDFKDGETVSGETLFKAGLIKSAGQKVKIVGGEISRKLTFKVPVTAPAKAAIEKAGGQVA